MSEQFHKYDHTDIRTNDRGDKEYPFMFVADVAQENSNLFVLDEEYVDNQWIAHRLKELGAVEDGVKLDHNPNIFYAYFASNHVGCQFLRKLSAWLSQKAHLLDKARSY
jgi:hypothetical protein